MKRLILFLTTNAAILLLLSFVFQLFGVEQWFYREGVNLNLEGLLIFSAVFGMGGSFISLALSKWLAKRSMGVRVLERPVDAGGAGLAGRDNMIGALRSLQHSHEQQGLPGTLAAFGITGGQDISRLFRSHPPLQQRIATLEHRDITPWRVELGH
jgi:Zn-dependent protease with chaperone function